MSKIFFLLNPSNPQKAWDYREAAGQAARRHGCVARFGQVERARRDSSEHLIRQAMEEGCERLAAVGGDGTLHRTVNIFQKLNLLNRMELAVVPAGTCNDFARFLGLSARALKPALDLACRGKAQATDLGAMDSELFLNNAGFGRRSMPTDKRLSPLKTLGHLQPIPLRAEWEKGSVDGSFFIGLACNGPFFSKGLHFSTHVSAHDGLLDIFLVPAMPKWRLLSLLALARLGRPARFRRLLTLRLPRLAVQAQNDFWPQADGEPAARAVRRVVFAIATEKAMIVQP